MTRALIYKFKGKFRVLDTHREILVGVYDTPHQARQGWGVYEVQGYKGSGFCPSYYDYYVIDIRKGIHEDTIKSALQRLREGEIEHESKRDKEISDLIERHKG